MANIQLLAPLILKWEGGYVNDPADLGGATNRSVNLATWRQWGYDKNGDGVVGEKTLHALNASPDPEGLFEKIKEVRKAYFNMICENRPANRRFLKGWLNRLNDFKWIPMALLFCVLLSCRSVQKTETLHEEQTVKSESQTMLTERKEYHEEQDGHLSENQNEVRTTETLTAVDRGQCHQFKQKRLKSHWKLLKKYYFYNYTKNDTR